MTSRHLLDPQLQPLLELLPQFSFDTLGIAAIRSAMPAPPATPLPDGIVSYARSIPGRPGDPDVRVVVTEPGARKHGRAGILHIHGGGFVLGKAELTRESDCLYARELDAVVVSVDYRLAPETRYPGAVEDCYAALAWLHGHADELGVDRNRIIVTGESAGGGLAAALVLLARHRGAISIAFQHLVFPMLDDRTVTATNPSPLFGEFVWTPEHNRFGWSSLLGVEPGSPNVSPFAAPARETDLGGLPPAFIAVGTLDLFLEEDINYASRLMQAGVPTELHVYPGAPHAFMLVRNADVSRAFERDSINALARAVRTQHPRDDK